MDDQTSGGASRPGPGLSKTSDRAARRARAQAVDESFAGALGAQALRALGVDGRTANTLESWLTSAAPGCVREITMRDTVRDDDALPRPVRVRLTAWENWSAPVSLSKLVVSVISRAKDPTREIEDAASQLASALQWFGREP